MLSSSMRTSRFTLPVAGILSLLLLLALTKNAQAQSGVDFAGTGGRHTIQGRIYFPSGRRADARLKVMLESTNSSGLSVVADDNGSFSFKSLTPGTYTIIIDAGESFEPVRERVYIDENRDRNVRGTGGAVARIITVPIYLQPKRGVDKSGSIGTVDASLVSVPKEAQELYQKALDSSRAGDSKTAIEQLNRAIEIYPQFALALNELGVQYLKINQPDKSVEPLRAAVKCAPDSFMPRLNYGIALLETAKFAEAEKELKEAVSKNSSSPVAHLYLGVAMVKLKNLNDAEKELLVVVESERKDLCIAHYYLGGIYWGKREYKRAADHLERYLKLAPDAPDAERIRGTIKELLNKK